MNKENHWPEYVSNHYIAPIPGNGYFIGFPSKTDLGNPRGDRTQLKAMQGSGEEPGTPEAKLEKIMLN